MVKKLLGGLCSSLIVLNLFGTTVGTKAHFIENNISVNNQAISKGKVNKIHINVGTKKTSSTPLRADINNIPVKFGGSEVINPEDFVAPFTSVQYRSISGEKLTVRLEGDTIFYELPEDTSVELFVTEYYTGDIVAVRENKSSFEVKCGSNLKTNVAYYLDMAITFKSSDIYDDQLVLSADSNGKLYFVKSPVYDYNVEMFSYLKTTDEFLSTCLKSEKDMESDNEEVIAFANRLCKNAKTDYEKVERIYDFVTNEMVYDTDQAEDPFGPYEDDVLSLIRRKIGVCEGFSNVFVALCRAMGIPATETYGSAFDCDELWTLNLEEDVVSSNHAWVAVYIDNEWLVMDPTWDNMSEYVKGEIIHRDATRDFAFTPIESFSYTHVFMDADISHAVKTSGECGSNATYEIDENGICTIYGSGSICMPIEVNDFFAIVFDESSNITEIEEDGFINCDLLDYIILPEGLETIGDYAFYHCENLEYVYVPDSVKKIGSSAFYFCDKLAFIEIPDGTKVGTKAFEMCPRLVISVANRGQVSVDSYVMKVAELIVRE